MLKIKRVSVQPTKVYDITVDKVHNFYANDALVHNCSEITLMTSKTRTAVCCLSSLNLEKYDEWKDTNLVHDLVRMLDNVLEYFIKLAPPELSRAVNSAKQERAIGLGTLGWHSYLQSKMIPFESGGFNSSIQYTNKIYSNIKNQAIEESKRLAKERGEPSDCRNSGMRNSHLMAIAPNASSSSLINVSPSIEPWSANAFTSKGRAGLFLIKNKHLEAILEERGYNNAAVWQAIIEDDGSVRNIDCLSDLEKEVFKTSREIDQAWIIEQASHRQNYVCQSQSVNLFVKKDMTRQEMSNLHMKAWLLGLKTLYYCRAQAEVEATVSKNTSQEVKQPLNAVEVTSATFETCLSCEG